MFEKMPHFELKRVFNDCSSKESPAIFPILSLPGSTQVNRRGFLGAGLAASAVAGLVSCSELLQMKNVRSSTKPIMNAGRKIQGICGMGVLAHRDSVKYISFSPDGKLLASKSFNEQIVKLWEMPSGMLTASLEGHTKSVNNISFSPDGKLLATDSDDDTIKVWEMPSGKLIVTLEERIESDNSGSLPSPPADRMRVHPFYFRSFSPDGKLLASSSNDTTIKLWEMPSGKLMTALKGHTDSIYSVSFSPDGKLLASGSNDGSIMLWEMPSGKLTTALKGHTDAIFSVSFSPDGKFLSSDSRDNTIKLWEMPAGRLVTTLGERPGPFYFRSFSSDWKLLASVSNDGSIKIWEMPMGKLTATLAGDVTIFDAFDYSNVLFSPDGKLLASIWGDTVKLWDTPSGKITASLEGHMGPVQSISISPDGKLLISGSSDQTIKLWGLPSGIFLTCLFDPATLEKDKEVIQYTGVNEYGQTMVYSGPCGSPIPPGFSCTCNCVPGTYERPEGGGSGTFCTCNQVCTCVPVYR